MSRCRRTIIERFYRQLQPPSIDEGFEEVVIVRDW